MTTIPMDAVLRDRIAEVIGELRAAGTPLTVATVTAGVMPRVEHWAREDRQSQLRAIVADAVTDLLAFRGLPGSGSPRTDPGA